MFLRAFRELATPFEVSEDALLREPEAWLPPIADAAAAERDGLLAEVGFGSEGRRIERRVRIELGPPVRMPGTTMLPLRWETVDGRATLPVLEADLELARLGPSRCQLALNGRYTPPLGRLGSVLDKAMLHRVAEATAWDFVDRVGRRLEGGGAEHAATRPGRPALGRPVG
jgi:hypothetical protein